MNSQAIARVSPGSTMPKAPRIRRLHEAATVGPRSDELARRRTASLEDANRELEAFSYSVSHDLRAPLRHIGAYGQILLEEHSGQLDAEGKRLLGVVLRNATQMSTLIEDLLALSRMARKELKLRLVDMGRLARSVAKRLREAEPERAIVFDIGRLGMTQGDAGLLCQVWTNLLANAVKFTRPVAEPCIELRHERGPGEHLYTVHDNGVGFDPAHAGKLFQPFERLHSASEFEGTGIGLAIVARVVQRHGGRVWAESSPGLGATFGFALPDSVAAT